MRVGDMRRPCGPQPETRDCPRHRGEGERQHCDRLYPGPSCAAAGRLLSGEGLALVGELVQERRRLPLVAMLALEVEHAIA
jgi:hypothetical protein